ncbi:hypothetical protein A33Q_3567 [Indibacter alkaliphilus LW1]|uniref:Uncharacterized protein n=1 Tax=Indibacter alkaliphilus (strain CCUG 57479 / KCTC 22604 / LW1) TaxID=1189612 RepID=S2DNV2_INDAL|nr:hypothetical protein A33Q_3567 [Indibacter alkaliphilus LW1]
MGIDFGLTPKRGLYSYQSPNQMNLNRTDLNWDRRPAV